MIKIKEYYDKYYPGQKFDYRVSVKPDNTAFLSLWFPCNHWEIQIEARFTVKDQLCIYILGTIICYHSLKLITDEYFEEKIKFYNGGESLIFHSRKFPRILYPIEEEEEEEGDDDVVVLEADSNTVEL